ncbi:MAG: N-acetylneuraminate synthase [bacterium]|nr:N-acetylneuraminate synthase [bacterium]
MKKVFIIAEAGINHNGDLALARRMIEVAAQAGADAVKFQSFKTESLLCRDAPKANYQQRNAGTKETQFRMLKKVELDIDAHRELIVCCREKGIVFLSSPFDLESIDMLHSLGLETIKIPSGEITNIPYLRKLGALKKRLIMSTGMADLEEIGEALEELTEAGTLKERITLLHCNTQYPTPMEDVNLSAMSTIREAFKITVGYSDHTPGIEIPIAAAALGAVVIEKHFTLDRGMEGPDHKASLEPDELAEMIKAVRNIEKAMGSGIKKASPSEEENKTIARKSIVAAWDIKKDEIITAGKLTVKRPGTGIASKHYDEIIGRKSQKEIKKDQQLKWSDLA